MLSRPENGWTDITIGEWTDRASYVSDVQIDLLDCFIKVFKDNNSHCVSCDAEGWEYIIVIDLNAIHIIESKDTYEYYSYDFMENNTTLKDVAKELYNDIKENLDAWSVWEPCLDLNDMGDIEEYQKKITDKLEILEKMLKEDK